MSYCECNAFKTWICNETGKCESFTNPHTLITLWWQNECDWNDPEDHVLIRASYWKFAANYILKKLSVTLSAAGEMLDCVSEIRSVLNNPKLIEIQSKNEWCIQSQCLSLFLPGQINRQDAACYNEERPINGWTGTRRDCMCFMLRTYIKLQSHILPHRCIIWSLFNSQTNTSIHSFMKWGRAQGLLEGSWNDPSPPDRN